MNGNYAVQHRGSGSWRGGFRSSALFLLFATLQSGCALVEETPDELAQHTNLLPGQISTAHFTLYTLERPQSDWSSARVYIEGDGRPWVGGGYLISLDPTPRRALALKWMTQDEKGQLYLGRPCYFGHAKDPGCTPDLWTSGRYSNAVIEAMAQALKIWLVTHPHRTLTLVGYSGGGVIALLLAERVAEVNRVVAVAAPIDIDIWTRLHDYTPLRESINPAHYSNWRSGVERILVFDTDDHNVPPATFSEFARRLPNSKVIQIPGGGHTPFEDSGWAKFIDGLATVDTR